MKLTNIFMMTQNGNGPGKDTPACDTPNPPFWCDNTTEPAASIDANLWILFALAVVLILIMNIKKSKWTAFKAWFLDLSRSCPNETKF